MRPVGSKRFCLVCADCIACVCLVCGGLHPVHRRCLVWRITASGRPSHQGRPLRLGCPGPCFWAIGAPGRCGHRAARSGQVASTLSLPPAHLPSELGVSIKAAAIISSAYLCDLDLELNYMGHVRDTPPHYEVLMCQVIKEYSVREESYSLDKIGWTDTHTHSRTDTQPPVVTAISSLPQAGSTTRSPRATCRALLII